MNNTVITLIYTRSSRANTAGLHPIYVRLTVNGQRSEFTTKKYVDPKKWDYRSMRVKGNTEEARSLNHYLDSLRNKILQTELHYQVQNQPVTVREFIDTLLGKKNFRERTLIPVFQDHNNRVASLIGTEFAQDTYQRYLTTLKHTQDFLNFRYRASDIALSSIDHAFITDFDFYLRSERSCSNNTTVKYMKNFKKIIRICLANGWMDRDPFLNYKVRLHEVDRAVLTQEELDRIIYKELPVDRLDIVRDIFIFSCFTGLAYVDVKNLTPAHIIRGIDGQYWIHTRRQKTDTASRIPLLDTAWTIIEKYRDHPKCNNEGTLLPVFTNQRMNAYLKEIAVLCQIEKTLTFHCARHTFATTITLNNGVPIESVSKMLGHTSIKTTQHYAKISDNKVASDMERLKQALTDLPIKKTNKNH